MLTPNDIIEKAKTIFVSNDGLNLPKEQLCCFSKNKPTIDAFLKERVYLKIGSNNANDAYLNNNAHHYTTKYWCNVLPIILSYIGINFNEKDFKKIENFDNKEDFSYLKPIKEKKYHVICTPCEYIENKKVWMNYINQQEFDYTFDDIINTDVYNFSFTKENTAYHQLFKFSHQCSTIINNEPEIGKTLIVSSNSHIIPLCGVLMYYYKKIIILDNRFNNLSFNEIYKNEKIENTECLLMLSYDNNLDKFIKGNL